MLFVNIVKLNTTVNQLCVQADVLTKEVWH